MTHRRGGMLSGLISLGTRLLPGAIYMHCRPVRRELNKEIRTILDVGCGKGLVGRFITRSGKYFTVGAEIYGPDLREARQNHTHSDFVQCDVRSLPFKRGSYDVVLCIEVLEHVDKEEGLKLLKDMEEIAVKKIILSTPRGYLHTSHEASLNPSTSSNPYQEHKAGWEADELRSLGYKVYYNNFFYKIAQYTNNHFPTWSWLLNTVIFASLGPLLWISPMFGADLFCVKYILPSASRDLVRGGQPWRKR